MVSLTSLISIICDPINYSLGRCPSRISIYLIRKTITGRSGLRLVRRMHHGAGILVSFNSYTIATGIPTVQGVLHGDTRNILGQNCLRLTSRGTRLPRTPNVIPRLVSHIAPIRRVIPVSVFVPNYPPSTSHVQTAVRPLLRKRRPGVTKHRVVGFK